MKKFPSNDLAAMRQRQPIQELERKAKKAARHKQKIWTVEELDWAHANAKLVYQWLKTE